MILFLSISQKTTVRFDTHFYMICQTQRSTFDTISYRFLLILLPYSISYRKTSAISFFVRLSSFFAHNLFTNFQYHKTIKNNNRFLIDFFHTFLSFEAGFMSVSFLIYHPDTLLQSPFLFTTMKKVSCINA